MAWCQIGDKPLSEPMLTHSTDAYMWHQEKMSNEAWTKWKTFSRTHFQIQFPKRIFFISFQISMKFAAKGSIHTKFAFGQVMACYWIGSKPLPELNCWGRVLHICISKQTITGSDNSLSLGCCQAIIWTNSGILLIGPSGTNFSEILIEIHTFVFRKMHLKMSSRKWQ